MGIAVIVMLALAVTTYDCILCWQESIIDGTQGVRFSSNSTDHYNMYFAIQYVIICIMISMEDSHATW